MSDPAVGIENRPIGSPAVPDPRFGLTSASAQRPVVAWLGLGAMGLPMAARLAAVGWDVWGVDLSASRRDTARKTGIRIAADPADAGRRTERFVVCIVRTAAQVEEALLGERGALRTTPGRCGIVMSSIGAEPVRDLAARARTLGCTLVDAPVLGNAEAAAAGALTIVTSGAAADIAAARPLLTALASSVVDLGRTPGTGQVMKIVSQMLQIVGMVATLEAMEMAVAQGVAEDVVLRVLGETAPSWAVERWDYVCDLWKRRDPATSLGIFAKDLAAALADATQVDVGLPLTEAALRILDARMRHD